MESIRQSRKMNYLSLYASGLLCFSRIKSIDFKVVLVTLCSFMHLSICHINKNLKLVPELCLTLC